MEQMITGKFVSVNEAASVLGCTVGRVRQLLRAGKLEGEKVSGRAWMVRAGSLRALERRPRTVGRKRVGERIDAN